MNDNVRQTFIISFMGIIFQDIHVMALSETHFRNDVPRERFTFSGYKSWHSDRGGMDKVIIYFV